MLEYVLLSLSSLAAEAGFYMVDLFHFFGTRLNVDTPGTAPLQRVKAWFGLKVIKVVNHDSPLDFILEQYVRYSDVHCFMQLL